MLVGLAEQNFLVQSERRLHFVLPKKYWKWWLDACYHSAFQGVRNNEWLCWLRNRKFKVVVYLFLWILMSDFLLSAAHDRAMIAAWNSLWCINECVSMYNAAWNVAQYSTPRNNVRTIEIVQIRIFLAKNLSWLTVQQRLPAEIRLL